MEIKKDGTSCRLSKVVCYGDTIYLSGIVAPKECQAIETQMEWELNAIESMLLAHGSDRKHILNAVIYLRNMSDFSAMNVVWETWFSDAEPPARTCVGTALASSHALVEITVTAARKAQ